MDERRATEILWDAFQKGEYFPEPLLGALAIEQAYGVQLGMLERWLAAGEKQAGWKAGATSAAARKAVGAEEPYFGYLLNKRALPSQQRFSFDEMRVAAVEVELCFTLSAQLKGPGVTREQAVAAVSAVAPALEIMEMRGDLNGERNLAIADNLMQYGFVTGPEVSPVPAGLDLAAVVAEISTNGQPVARVAGGGEFMDDQYATLAWLANKLAGFGKALEPGMRIMSGSYIKPTPVAKGDTWQATFAGIGTVSATYA